MSVLFKRGGAAALVYSISVSGAWADLTAQDVWSDWQAYLSGAGYAISATESLSGGTLTITDLAMAITIADISDGADGNFTVHIPDITLTEKGDGTVAMSMPAQAMLVVDGDADGDKVHIEMDYNQTGMSMIVSGAPNDMTYNYTAAAVEIGLANVTVDGETMPPGLMAAAVTMNNVITSARMQVGAMRTVSQNMRAESLDYAMSFDDPESDDGGTFEGRLVNLGFEGSGDIPLDMDPSNMRTMLDQGFAFDGTFTYGGGKMHLDAVGDGENVRVDSNSQGGLFRVAMDSKSLTYNLGQTGVNLEMESGELPFPVAMSMAESGLKLTMPAALSDDEQDFAFALNLTDFTMSDMIWMIFDAGEVLPRDPASILVDLTGKAKVFFDIFDAEAAMQMGENGEPPAELNQLSVNDLLVSAAGAALSGNGAFTFDNADLVSFDGVPRPEGILNLKLVGANGLLDKLIQMGFVADQDAMMARGMMGMFASPGDGPDTLNSKIEVNAEGQVFANGQRLK